MGGYKGFVYPVLGPTMNLCQELLEELKSVLVTDKCDEDTIKTIRTYLDMLESCIKASGEVFEMLEDIDKTLKNMQSVASKVLEQLYEKTN